MSRSGLSRLLVFLILNYLHAALCERLTTKTETKVNFQQLPASYRAILSFCKTGKSLRQITEYLQYSPSTLYTQVSTLQRLGLMSKELNQSGSIFLTLPEDQRREPTPSKAIKRNNGMALDQKILEICKGGARMPELVERIKMTHAYIGRRLAGLSANGQITKIKLAARREWAYLSHGTELDPRYLNKDATLFVRPEMIEIKNSEHERSPGTNEDFVRQSHNIWRVAA